MSLFRQRIELSQVVRDLRHPGLDACFNDICHLCGQRSTWRRQGLLEHGTTFGFGVQDTEDLAQIHKVDTQPDGCVFLVA